MKAFVLREHSFEVEEMPIPELNSGEVLVKIRFAALNHRDQWIRVGQYAKIQLPAVLGSDGVGVVEKVYNEEDSTWIGKTVLINPNINWGNNPHVQDKAYQILGMPTQGTLATYVKVYRDRLVEKPSYLTDEESAAISLAGLTAYNALFNKGAVTAETRVLISGVGGGVAQFAFLFAVASGAEVWVSSSKENVLQTCMKMGAKGTINYKNPDAYKELTKSSVSFDVIIDSAGGDQVNALLSCLTPGGKYVFYGATNGIPSGLNLRTIFWNHLQLLGSTMGSDQDFNSMLAFCEQHQIHPIIDKCFDFNDTALAFDRMAAGQQFGKILVKVE